VPEFIVGASPLPAAIAKRLQRYIQPDLVAVLEAVHHCLGRVVDANAYASYRMLFHASLKGALREANEPKWWVVDLRSPRLVPNSKPYLRGRLGG
jgi:hypothetical protein